MASPDPEMRVIALSSGLGRNALVFDDDEIVRFLRTAVECEGNKTAFAKRYGIDRTDLSAVLNGRKRVSGHSLHALVAAGLTDCIPER
jgi:hypothetical protein